MKRALILSLFLLPLLIFAYSTALAAEYRSIPGSTLDEFLLDPESEIIIDVREPELFSAGHVPGAINIEYGDAKRSGLDNLPKDKSTRIVFICHGGPMGDKLSRKLVDRGYTNVHNLAGGMRTWKGALTKE